MLQRTDATKTQSDQQVEKQLQRNILNMYLLLYVNLTYIYCSK